MKRILIKRVVIYVRVSTGRQADFNLSIPDQIESIKRWCAQNGYEVVEVYIDEGLTGTDDRRPAFQRMIADACGSGQRPFDAIIVHSLSRFFRDEVEFTLYERRLKKHGVTIESITQEGLNNEQSEVCRRMMAIMDEQASKENAKHTLRCMIRNAEKGYFNGGEVPFGYGIRETDEPARTGRKKVLIVDEEEAKIVRKIYDLYIERNFGFKKIASHLNEMNILRRGENWSISTINLILTNTVYYGEKLFNQKDWKTKQAKPEDEIIRISVPPIVSRDTFELAKHKRAKRSPEQSHPRRLSSPHLLTSVLKCDICGAAMTMATGTGIGGLYYYYRCTTKTKKHKHLCSSRPLPMQKFDNAILTALADSVFTPERVTVILREMKKQMNPGSGDDIKTLQKELDIVKLKINRLYDAIEDGNVANDEETKARMDRHKQKRAEIMAKVENYDQSPRAMLNQVSTKEVKQWTSLLREKLLDQSTGFSKEYLQLLISKIAVNGNQVTISGDSLVLVGAIKFAAEKKNPVTAQAVIGFNEVWRARRDSNSRHPGSK